MNVHLASCIYILDVHLPNFLFDCVCYLVSKGVILDWILCCQTDAAEQDEEEDEVCEDVVVDDLMAQNPKSTKQSDRHTETEGLRDKVSKSFCSFNYFICAGLN